MGFTQKHADQNCAMAARAATLLNERGWDPDLEETNFFGQLTGPQWQIIQDVIKDVSAEFEGIAFNRVQSQVHGVCGKARGRWRREQLKERN